METEVCGKGHALTDANVVRHLLPARRCRTCWNAYQNNYKKRRRGTAALWTVNPADLEAALQRISERFDALDAKIQARAAKLLEEAK